MKQRRVQTFFVATLILTDMLMAGSAFYVAYALRRWLPLPTPATNMSDPIRYLPMMSTHVLSLAHQLAHGLLNQWHVDGGHRLFNLFL